MEKHSISVNDSGIASSSDASRNARSGSSETTCRQAKTLVRLTYFDEAGSSSDEEQEPIIVVAATIVHGDLQSLAIENDAQGIIARFVPSPLRENFEFHGKDLYSGSNRLRGWRKSERHDALKEFLRIIPKYNLPVVYFGLSKEALWKTTQGMVSKDEEPYLDHQIAFLFCAGGVETWFRGNANFERLACPPTYSHL